LVRPSIRLKLNDEKEIEGKKRKRKEEMEEKLNYFSLIFTKHKYISAKTKGGSSLQYNSTQYYKKKLQIKLKE